MDFFMTPTSLAQKKKSALGTRGQFNSAGVGDSPRTPHSLRTPHSQHKPLPSASASVPERNRPLSAVSDIPSKK
jgi:hypothetical protein